jgi:hypothetical protein
MDRRLSVVAAAVGAIALAGAAAVGATRVPVVQPACGATDPSASPSLPWWKRALSHTVQEEWAFAQAMDAQYGPRWRTALPDKVVSHLWQSWRNRSPTPP